MCSAGLVEPDSVQVPELVTGPRVSFSSAVSYLVTRVLPGKRYDSLPTSFSHLLKQASCLRLVIQTNRLERWHWVYSVWRWWLECSYTSLVVEPRVWER